VKLEPQPALARLFPLRVYSSSRRTRVSQLAQQGSPRRALMANQLPQIQLVIALSALSQQALMAMQAVPRR